MKNYLLLTLLGFAILLTSTTAEAKRYGGLKVGDSFSMKVRTVESTSQVGFSGTETPAPAHAAAVSYRKGQVVKFRIKARGRLSARGLRIPFAHASKKMVEFNDYVPGTVSVTHNAELTLKKKKPTRGTISVFIRDDSGAEPVFYTTIYTLR